MGHFSSMLDGLARTFTTSKRRTNSSQCGGKEAAEAMAKDAKKNEMLLRSSGTVSVNGSNNFASVCSKKGEKGVNQDCCIVWEEFGCQEDLMFCGVFDGHGPWGHYVAKRVCNSMASSLLCNWQEMLVKGSSVDEVNEKVDRFSLWQHSFIKTCADVDQDLVRYRKIDSVHSGTTALTAIRQGDHLVVANVGDSRAVLATVTDDGCLVPVQLTVDFKPNLPEEAERIMECNGRVFCLEDEPGLHRIWLPNEESPGLAMSRAFGDYCLKNFGLISVPEVIQRHITSRDHFMVLASDGVWDVVSNEEAVEIVSSTADQAKAAKRLVDYAVRAWKRKRKTIAADDMSAVCIFFHNNGPSSHQIHSVATPK
uniref:probable protein phosphatase 2C 34 n=1 Tax=Erigeron canadensis TaxID=72917 RepID=UPI001CB91C42|nr:probable protein phosphatase 2C 34 [Erigeron canadensis]XP_043618864.1 probable protein phosphatase 2C 34 [Erigeron canadensis]XP_043618865.1 probable protein phosphatase 2C 34 [Erigeron canadensis]